MLNSSNNGKSIKKLKRYSTRRKVFGLIASLVLLIIMVFSINNQMEKFKLQIIQLENQLHKKPKILKTDDSSIIKIQPHLAAIEIDSLLKNCNDNDALSNEEFHNSIVLNGILNKKKQSHQDFICKAKCESIEPELEHSLRALNIGKYSFDTLWKLCNTQRIPFLIWINNSKVSWYKCKEIGPINASTQWIAVRRLLLALNEMIELPNVLLGFDNSDWSTPHTNDPHLMSWLYTLPAVLRFVGSESNPSFLWPTVPYLRVTAYCNIDIANGNVKEWLKYCPYHQERFKRFEVNWQDKKKTLFWRGSPTGMPLFDGYISLLNRPAFIERFYKLPQYDIAFLEHAIPPYATKDFLANNPWKKGVKKEAFGEYKLIISLDGHTASWGLIEKLISKSALIIHDSLQGYREFYYKLLKPWKHFIPLKVDMNELEDIKNYVLNSNQGDADAEVIGKEAFNFIKTRMRPQDTFCYLNRLIKSIARQQKVEPTYSNLKAEGINVDKFKPIDLVSVEKKSKFENE